MGKEVNVLSSKWYHAQHMPLVRPNAADADG